ncbi:MAG: hypothetical protein ACD_46C00131G0001 [uncultured bacterium]|nr:MAG: hypothetical protein ACD_46C00131G0001 [uncultured bacterium]
MSLISREIDTNGGAISFATFMELALYHPIVGYYNSPNFSLGNDGDFITAPHISSLFAKCLARQCASILQALSSKNILELGPGEARLTADLLHELQQQNCLPEHYFLYEISENLRQKQQDFLQKTCPQWMNRIVFLNEIPEKFSGLIIGNEVLDAIPVDLFAIENHTLKERCVAQKNGEFYWLNHEPQSAIFAENGAHILRQYALPNGYQSELHLQLASFIQRISRALTQGVAIFIDYGYAEAEYYHPERTQGTLTCFYRHQKHGNPLINPGAQDITAHVNFTRVIEVAAENGCELAGYTTQAAFLLACGLLDLAAEEEKNLSSTQEFKLHQAIKTLTLPTEMGEIVKVMALSKHFDLPLTGFAFQDRRRDL